MEDMFIISQNNPWDWYIYLHDWLIFKVNVGKYTIHGSYGFVYYLFMLYFVHVDVFGVQPKFLFKILWGIWTILAMSWRTMKLKLTILVMRFKGEHLTKTLWHPGRRGQVFSICWGLGWKAIDCRGEMMEMKQTISLIEEDLLRHANKETGSDSPKNTNAFEAWDMLCWCCFVSRCWWEIWFSTGIRSWWRVLACHSLNGTCAEPYKVHVLMKTTGNLWVRIRTTWYSVHCHWKEAILAAKISASEVLH